MAGVILSAAAIHAQDEPLSESGALALEATLEKLTLQYDVLFTFDLDKVTKPAWKQGMRRIKEAEFKHAAHYIEIFSQEFEKYPRDFIDASKLKAVVFVADLDISGQARKSVPDYVNEVLYMDIHGLRGSSPRYARHVVHHEFYHMLEEEWNGSAYFKDPAWAALNKPDWKYGTGGAQMQSGNVWEYNHPAPGFINAYSTAALEEDKAEVWATLFVPESWKIVEPWLKEDTILRAKIAFLKAAAKQKSAEMDEAFWQRLTREPVG